MDVEQSQIFLYMAENTAREAHRGQFRRDGITPYIEHVETVVNNCKGHLVAMIVAWLHDVLEDSDITEDDLRDDGYPEYIIEAVKLLTKPKGSNYLEYISKIKENPLARQVKLADMSANLSDTPSEKQTLKYSLAIQILTNFVVREECNHTQLMYGPRVPARYGSFETEVCVKCGAWRTTNHTLSHWHHNDISEAVKEAEEF